MVRALLHFKDWGHRASGTLLLNQILEQLDNYFWSYCISNILGYRESSLKPFFVDLVIETILDVASDTLPLYTF